MGRYEVVFGCAFLCMLQFHIGNAACVELQLRMPASSINGKLQQFNTKVPYPLSRQGNNICNFCKGSICNSSCGLNNQYKFKSPPNFFVISVPTNKSESGKMSITIDTRKKCPVIPSPEKTVPEAPAVNGETFKQNVVIKVVPIDIEGDSGTITSGSSTATSDENIEQLTSVLKAIVGIPGSDQKFQVLVFINDTYSGNGRLGDISLDSYIIATDGQGDVSETITQSEIKEKPIDGSDSPITDPATPDDTNPDPVAPSTSDSKNPEPEEEVRPPSGKGGEEIPVPPLDDGEKAKPGPPLSDEGEEAATDPAPPLDDTDPSVSSSAASEGAADGEGAKTSSTTGSAAESG